MAKKKNKKGITKVEKFIYSVCTLISIILIVGIVFGQTTLSKINFEVEKLKEDLKKQENTNQSLTMVINEMASLENIQAVATEQGLTYNNDNIKTITE